MNSPRFAVIHIAKSLKKASAQTKTCQRVCLPKHTGKADPDKTKISA